MEEKNDFLNLTEEDQLNSNDDQNNAPPQGENNENKAENNTNQENPVLTETIANTTQGLLGTNENQPTGDQQPPEEANNNEKENLTQIPESLPNAADAIVDSIVDKTEGLENTEEPKNTDNEVDNTNKEPENNENISGIAETFTNTVDAVASALDDETKDKDNTEPQENAEKEPGNVEEQENPENVSEMNEAFKSTVDAMAGSLINPSESTEKEPGNAEEQGNAENVSEMNEAFKNTVDAMTDSLVNPPENTEKEPENTENQENAEPENPEPENPSETAGTLSNVVDAMTDALTPQTENQENTENQNNQNETENPENQENPENPENPNNTDNQNNTDETAGTLQEIGQEITESLFTNDNTSKSPQTEDQANDDEPLSNLEVQTDETAKEYVYDSGLVSLLADPTTLHDRFLFNHVVSLEIFTENEPTCCLFSATTDTRVLESYCKYLKHSDVTTFHFTTRNKENEDGFDTFFTFCTGKELTTLLNPTEEQISAAMNSFKQSFVIPCSIEDSEKLQSYEKVSKNERYASKSMIEYVNDQIRQQKESLNTDSYEYENPVTFSSFLNVSIDSFLGHLVSITGDECERYSSTDHEYTHDNQRCSIYDNDFDFHSLLGINNVREIELSPNKFVHCLFSSTEDKVLDTFLSVTQIGKTVSFHFSNSPNGHVNYFTLCTGETLISLINPSQDTMNIVFNYVKKSYLIPCGLNDKKRLFFYDYMNKINKIASDKDALLIEEEIKAVQESVYMKKWKYDIASSYEKFLNISYTAFIGYLVRGQYLDAVVQPNEFRSFDVHDFIILRKLDYGKRVALNWAEGKVYIIKEYRDLHKFNQAIYLYKNNKMKQIVPFYGEAINNENYLVFGLLSRGTLKEVSKNEYVNISVSRKITIQLVFLLAYLHMTDTKPCNISADNISIDWEYNAYLSDIDGAEKVINCTPEQLDVKNLGNTLYTLVTGQSPNSSFSRGIPSNYETVSHIYELTKKPDTNAFDLVSDILSNKTLFSKEEMLINDLLSLLPHEFETLDAFEDCSFNYFKFNCREINEDHINFIKTLKFGHTATIQFISDENDNDNRIFIFETNKICGTLKNASPKVVNLIASKMKNCTVVSVSDRDLDIFFEYYNFDLIQNFIREPQLSVFRKNASEASKEMNEFPDKFIVEETLALSYAISNPTKYRVLMEEPVSITPQFPSVSLLNEEFNLKTEMPKNQVRLIEIFDDFNLLCLYSTEEDYTFNEFMRDFNRDKFVVVHFSNDFVSFCSNKKLLLLKTTDENDKVNNQVNKVINLVKDTKIFGVCPDDRTRLFAFPNFDMIKQFATPQEMGELCKKVEENRDNFFTQNFTFDKPPMTYSTYFNHCKCTITGYYLLVNPDFEHNSQSLSKMVEQSIDFAASLEKAEDNQPQTPTQTFVDFSTEEDLKKALTLYNLAAERNDPSAFFNLGLMYSTGQGVEKDKEIAADYYKKSAELENPKAQYNLGLMYYKGEGVELDKKEAARLYQLAADQGVAKAQTNLGLMYSKGDGIEQDYEKAVQLYEQAVLQNDPDAQLNLGMMIDQGQGTPVDKERVIDLYTKSAENGNAKAQFNLGVIYHNGEKGILQKDNKKAVKYYSMAASKGLAKAQFNLGVLYSKGDEDIPVDKKMAAQLFQLAADQGDSDAQLNLGAMYAKGEGVEKVDKQKTAELYKKAAKQGNPKAQFNLAVMHSKGDGIPKNYKKAVKYYQKASDQDISQASFNLGVIYFRGAEGVEEDKTKAAELFEKAAELNPKNSKALFNLAIMNMKGEGVDKDEGKALDYFEKAAELDNKDALLNLGMIYMEGGCGVEPNKKKAFSYYERAALLGNDKAQLNLGIMLQNGEGCEKDLEKAKEMFQLSADQGNPQAQINLGLLLIGRDDEIKEAQKKQLEESAEKGNIESMYELGCKYQEDDDVENAVKWFSKAAANENSKAQLELGKIYLYGKQSEVDLNKSELFLQSAAKNNEPDASVYLEQLNEEKEKIERSIALERQRREEEEAQKQQIEQTVEEEEEPKEPENQEQQEEQQENQEQENEEPKSNENQEQQEEPNENQEQENIESKSTEVQEQENEEPNENQEQEEEPKSNEVQEQEIGEPKPKERSVKFELIQGETEDQDDEQPQPETKSVDPEENVIELQNYEEPKQEEPNETAQIQPQSQQEEETEPKNATTEDDNFKLTAGEEDEEEESASVEQTLKLDVTDDNETPPHEKEEQSKLKETAGTLSLDEEETEEESCPTSTEDPFTNLNATLEDRIKTLSSVSNTSYTDTPSALDELYDRFVCNSLHKQLLENSRIYKSLKKNIEEATDIINKSSSSSQTSSLPSLKKSTNNKVRFSDDQEEDNIEDDDEELSRIKSDCLNLESQISQIQQQISNSVQKPKQVNQNNSVRPSTLIREPDTPKQPRTKSVKIQSPRSARNKIKHLQKKADEGDASSQYLLGACYSTGQGVEKDKEKGFEFYLKSAEQGYASGQFAVASCYTYGRGTKVNRQKALEYYMMAADQGHDKSQFAVGHFYDCGYGGVQQDHEKAVEWYRKAASQGHQGAIEQLKSESDESPLLSAEKVSDE